MNKFKAIKIRVWFTAACAAVIFFLSVGSVMADQADEKKLDEALTVAKAALEDELYTVAEKHFKSYLKKVRGTDRETEDVFVYLVRCIYGQGNYDDLLRVLDKGDKWSKKGSGTGALLYWRATAFYAKGDIKEVLENLDLLSKTFATSKYLAQGERLRAFAHLKISQLDKSIESFAKFDKNYPESPDVPQNLYDWASILVKSDRQLEAVSILERLVKMQDDLLAVNQGRYLLADLLMKDAKWDAASKVLNPICTNNVPLPSLKAQAWFSMCKVQNATSNDVAAVAAFSNGMALAISPDVKQKARYEIGHFLLENSKYEKAIPILKSYISLTPDDPGAESTQLMIGDVLLKIGKTEEAVNEYQYYLETFTNSAGLVKANFNRGLGFIQIGRFAEAAAAFNKAHDLTDDVVKKQECIFKIGDARFLNGQNAMATKVYNRLLKEYPESKLIPNVLFQQGECSARARKYAKAEQKFMLIRSKYPDSAHAEEALLRIAEMQEAQGQLDSAVESYKLVMDTYKSGKYSANALYGRGRTYYKQWKMKRAMTDFNNVIKRYPESEVMQQAFYMRGMCYYWIGEDASALQICNEFITKYPDSRYAPNVLFWIGEYNYNQGDFKAAESNMVTISTKYSTDRLADDALLWAGLATSKQKEFIRSIEILTKMIKDYPTSKKIPDARFAQANALFELARVSEAILIYDEIINKHSKSELVNSAWIRKGDCQFLLGTENKQRYVESIKSYSVVVASSDVDLDLAMQAEYKIGRCYEKMDKSDEAFDQYYFKVILRFLQSKNEGEWHGSSAESSFTSAVFKAVDILKAKKEWRKAVNLLERLADVDVPEADEAKSKEEIEKIKLEHWWIFYK